MINTGHFSDEQIDALLGATEGYWSGGIEPRDAVFKTLNHLYKNGWCVLEKTSVEAAVDDARGYDW